MAKEFKKAAAAARPVYRTIIGSAGQEKDTQEVQEVHNAHDVQQEMQQTQETVARRGAPKTQGRKGERMPRINMAFTPENLEYLRVMAALDGESITAYVNGLVEEDQRKRTVTYAAAKKLHTNAGKK